MGEHGLTTTEVEIFGALYPVRGEHDSEYLREIAGLVDRRMREIAGHVKTVDMAKIAILAALNLADELVRGQREREGERDQFVEKVAQLAARLERVLESDEEVPAKAAEQS